jgi:hypothetical protein
VTDVVQTLVDSAPQGKSSKYKRRSKKVKTKPIAMYDSLIKRITALKLGHLNSEHKILLYIGYSGNSTSYHWRQVGKGVPEVTIWALEGLYLQVSDVSIKTYATKREAVPEPQFNMKELIGLLTLASLASDRVLILSVAHAIGDLSQGIVDA